MNMHQGHSSREEGERDVAVSTAVLASFGDLFRVALVEWKAYWVPVTGLLLAPTMLSVVGELFPLSFPYAKEVVAFVVALVSYFVGCGVIAIAFNYDDARASISLAFRAAIALAPALFIIALLRGLVVFGGMGLLILPGLYFLIALMFAQCVYVKERKRGLAALAESWRIFAAQPWQIVLRVVALGVVMGVFSMVVDGLIGMLTLLSSVRDSVSTIVANLILVPMGIFYGAALYEKVRDIPFLGMSMEERERKMKYLAVFGVVVFIALILFVGYALVEYSPQWVKNAILRINPPGIAL